LRRPEGAVTWGFARIPPRPRSPVRVWPARTSDDVRASSYPRLTAFGLMTTTKHLPRRRPRIAVRVLVLLCAVGGLLGTIPVNTASAAPIDDLRAQAADLEQQMNQVGSQLGNLYEQIKAKQYDIDQAKQTIADSQAGIVSAQGEVARITDLVRERAATVYRRAGSTGVTEFDTNIKASASRSKYADATSQKDNQLLNKLARAKEDLAAREAAAEKVRADVQEKQDALKAQQADFQAQQDQATELVIGAAPASGDTPIKYKVEETWYDLSPFPSHIRPDVISELVRMAKFHASQIPGEGVLDESFGDIRLRWIVAMMSADGECMLVRVQD